ncbi:hypothetical protein NQD34_008790 [Periophthalmus magnuspinnatus]|nr:hypothetical protein NQD34_008790 [Periophthalmus magnuspinnatus]
MHTKSYYKMEGRFIICSTCNTTAGVILHAQTLSKYLQKDNSRIPYSVSLFTGIQREAPQSRHRGGCACPSPPSHAPLQLSFGLRWSPLTPPPTDRPTPVRPALIHSSHSPPRQCSTCSSPSL